MINMNMAFKGLWDDEAPKTVAVTIYNNKRFPVEDLKAMCSKMAESNVLIMEPPIQENTYLATCQNLNDAKKLLNSVQQQNPGIAVKILDIRMNPNAAFNNSPTNYPRQNFPNVNRFGMGQQNNNFQPSHACMNCNRVAAKKCSACGTNYCSRECQLKHWGQHYNVCNPPRLDDIETIHNQSNYGTRTSNITDRLIVNQSRDYLSKPMSSNTYQYDKIGSNEYSGDVNKENYSNDNWQSGNRRSNDRQPNRQSNDGNKDNRSYNESGQRNQNQSFDSPPIPVTNRRSNDGNKDNRSRNESGQRNQNQFFDSPSLSAPNRRSNDGNKDNRSHNESGQRNQNQFFDSPSLSAPNRRSNDGRNDKFNNENGQRTENQSVDDKPVSTTNRRSNDGNRDGKFNNENGQRNRNQSFDDKPVQSTNRRSNDGNRDGNRDGQFNNNTGNRNRNQSFDSKSSGSMTNNSGSNEHTGRRQNDDVVDAKPAASTTHNDDRTNDGNRNGQKAGAIPNTCSNDRKTDDHSTINKSPNSKSETVTQQPNTNSDLATKIADQKPSAVSKKIPAVNYPKSGSIVTITAIVDNSCEYIYIRPMDQESNEAYCTIINDIMEYSQNAKPLETVPERNDICLAQFSEDECYYRAIVLNSKSNSLDVSVAFIDFGNKETTPLKHLKHLDDHLQVKMRYTIRVKLDSVKINADNEKPYDYLKDCSNNMINFRMEYSESNKNNVKLFDCSTGELLNEYIMKLGGNAPNNSKPEIVENHPNDSKTVDASNGSKSIEKYFAQDMILKDFSGKDVEVMILDHSQLKLNQMATILAEDWSTYNDYDLKIQEYCSKMNEPYGPEVDELCLAKCAISNHWLRGCCIEKSNANQRTICMLDRAWIGNKEISIENIRKIPKQFVFEGLIKPCSIYGLPSTLSVDVITHCKKFIPMVTNITVDFITEEETASDENTYLHIKKCVEDLKSKNLI